MSTNHRHQPAIFRTLLIVLLLCFGTELKAQSPEARPNAEPTSSDQTSEIRKFTFKHAKADEAWKMIQKLAVSTNDNTPGIVVDDRSNSIFFKVNLVNDARRLEELFALLDTEPSVNPPMKAPFPYRPIPASGSPQQDQTFTISMGLERGESIETLKQHYNDLEQHAHQLAEKLKQSKLPDALSSMFDAIGGASRGEPTIQGYIVNLRKSAESISDHRKFCVEMMKAYQKLTNKPFAYFDGVELNPEWQVVQLSERAALGTLGDGTTPAHKISLQQVNGTWRISSLFNEDLKKEGQTGELPKSVNIDLKSSKIITKRYSVGSLVTESNFVGKGNHDLKEVYDKYEVEIEQSLQQLAKTVTSTCAQPPKFVQVLSDSRSLLVGHTAKGHQEIASFMSDIGINNDRIRLRCVGIEITHDDAKTLGIDLKQQVLSPEQVEKLREFLTNKSSSSENGNDPVIVIAMDEIIVSGTRTPLKVTGAPVSLTVASRIVPGTDEIQIRTDMHGLGNSEVQYVFPRFQTLSDGSVSFHPLNARARLKSGKPTWTSLDRVQARA